MKILLDENIDQAFPPLMPEEEVRHVVTQGWQGTKNGALLTKAAAAGFEVFIIADKNMPYQQSMGGRPFALIVLDIHPNTITSRTACVPFIRALLPSIRPGEVHVVQGPHPKRARG